MQHVKLCSESLENSLFLEAAGASSSDMAEVLPESSSTTGAVRKDDLKLYDSYFNDG